LHRPCNYMACFSAGFAWCKSGSLALSNSQILKHIEYKAALHFHFFPKLVHSYLKFFIERVMKVKVNDKSIEIPEASTPKDMVEKLHLTAPEQAVRWSFSTISLGVLASGISIDLSLTLSC